MSQKRKPGVGEKYATPEEIAIAQILIEGQPDHAVDWGIIVRQGLNGTQPERTRFNTAIGEAIYTQYLSILSQCLGRPGRPPAANIPHWPFMAAQAVIAHYKLMMERAGLEMTEEENLIGRVRTILAVILGPEGNQWDIDHDGRIFRS